MRQKRSLYVRLVAIFIAALLCTCAAIFLAFAAYLTLQESMTAMQAALVTAAACLLLALMVWLLMRWVLRRRGRRQAGDPRDMLEDALQSYADPMLREWARHHPDRALIVSVLLGIAAGYSAPVRRLMRDLYGQLADRERPRSKSR
jgi:ABC-type nickel/cobalt efflux system permease component RcnA